MESKNEPEPTPPGHTVIGLRIEAALLPDWWDEVRQVASRFVRRMAVIERPEGLVVQCELRVEQVEAFHAALASHWEKFNERQ
jgi:hypothetical protein